MHWLDSLAIVGAAFVCGSMVGSFLNVVIHRMPKGRRWSSAGRGARRAAAPVRPRDNIPIIGWLVLRGRCRDCGQPISPRYPLVEAGCGLLAAMVACGRRLPAAV